MVVRTGGVALAEVVFHSYAMHIEEYIGTLHIPICSLRYVFLPLTSYRVGHINWDKIIFPITALFSTGS